MTPDLDPATDLSFTRTLAVPSQLVWECWTDPKHIPHFFVPKPHKVTAVDIDLRVGGRFNTTFEVEGNAMDNHGVYLEVVPLEKLVFTDAYTEAWQPSDKPFMTVILTFEDDAGKTRYTARARHWTVADREQHEAMGFHQGWGQCADQLAALVARL